MGASNELFLAITAADGSVYKTSRSGDLSAHWETFSKVTELDQPTRKNVSVTVTNQSDICATDDSLLRQLRYAFTGYPAVRISTGAALARASVASGPSNVAVLAIGSPTVESWSFGLPLLLFNTSRKATHRVGDETTGIDAGDLDLTDPAVALDMAGSFADASRQYQLCIATESGGLYYAAVGDPGSPRRFQDVKAAAGDPGNVVSVSCSPGHEGLHVCVTNDAGGIRHAIRHPDGTWSAFADVNAATGSSDAFSQVAISHYSNPTAPRNVGFLHLAGLTRTGGLLYTVRSGEDTPDPLWAPFLDVKSKAGDRGLVTSVDIDVSPYVIG